MPTEPFQFGDASIRAAGGITGLPPDFISRGVHTGLEPAFQTQNAESWQSPGIVILDCLVICS
jgi:hypothetical protein